MNTAILFDMDGVILDTEPLYTKAEIRLFKEYGVEIPAKDWSLFRGCSEQDFFTLSMKRYNISENRNIFMNKGRKYVKEEFNKNLQFMPGFHSLINRLKIQHKIGLVTASPRHNLNWLNNKIKLNSFFPHIISGEESKRNKPYPDPYLDMLQLLNIKAYRAIVVEDSLNGINAALAAGTHVIAKRGSIPDHELSIAHRIITNLNEITDQLIHDLLQEKI